MPDLTISNSQLPDPTIEMVLAQQPSHPIPALNYFARHWRGEFSLPVSFWFNGIILAAVTLFIFSTTVDEIGNGTYSLRAQTLVTLAVVFFSSTVWLWSGVGVFRSASYHLARCGKSIWAGLAILVVLAAFMTTVSKLTVNPFPMIKEFALIASGNDPVGRINVEVSANGQSIVVVGAFGEGSAVEIRNVLERAPGATSLILDSNGGRVFEAELVARMVRDRKLDTYVENQCASACTLVFLAGQTRTAAHTAKIGFHQPVLPGTNAETQDSITRTLLATYRAIGLPEHFIQHIGTIPPEDIWYPTHSELLAANIATRIN